MSQPQGAGTSCEHSGQKNRPAAAPLPPPPRGVETLSLPTAVFQSAGRCPPGARADLPTPAVPRPGRQLAPRPPHGGEWKKPGHGDTLPPLAVWPGARQWLSLGLQALAHPGMGSELSEASTWPFHAGHAAFQGTRRPGRAHWGTQGHLLGKDGAGLDSGLCESAWESGRVESREQAKGERAERRSHRHRQTDRQTEGDTEGRRPRLSCESQRSSRPHRARRALAVGTGASQE